MSPEKHAIRNLEKSLDGATPEVASAIAHVILSLNTVILNKDPAARALAKNLLARDLESLEEILKSNG